LWKIKNIIAAVEILNLAFGSMTLTKEPLEAKNMMFSAVNYWLCLNSYKHGNDAEIRRHTQ
jgi:hypothetical protein